MAEHEGICKTGGEQGGGVSLLTICLDSVTPRGLTHLLRHADNNHALLLALASRERRMDGRQTTGSACGSHTGDL